MPPYLTRAEVSQLCRVSVQTVSAWLHAGKLPQPRRVGKSYLWRTEEVFRHLEQQQGQHYRTKDFSP